MLVSILLVPLLLGGLGGWERSRAHGSIAEYAALKEQLPQRVREMRALGERDRYASIDLGDPNTVYAPALAADKVEAMLPSISRSLFLARLQVALAWIVMAGAALAMIFGAIGLVGARLAARRALASRDALVASFAAFQRALPLLLGGMVIGLVLAVVGAILFELISLWSSVTLSGASIKLMALGLGMGALAIGIAWSAVRALREVAALYTPEPGQLSGRAISAAEAPALWRFVQDIAGRQQAIAPDTVVLGMDQGFHVTEQELLLSPGARRIEGRTLYLPAPYLHFLDEGEVAAIVGHELAHFTGEDTAYSRRFVPLYAGLRRALGAMQADSNGLLLLKGPLQFASHAMEQFDHTVQHWSRLREFEADRLGSITSSPRDAASALVRTAVVAAPVSLVLNDAFSQPPEDDRDLIAAASQLVEEKGWPDIRAYLEDVQAHPSDTHPATPERIRRLGVALDDTLLATALRPPRNDTPSAGERLIGDWAGWCRTLSADYLDEARGAHARHRQYLTDTAAAVSQEAVTLYNNVGPVAWVQFGAAILFAFAGAAIWIYRQPLGFGHDGFALNLILGTCIFATLLCLVAGMLIRRSGRMPFLILTPEALRSPKLSSPIAWRDVEGWGVAYGSRFGLDLLMNEGVTLPRVEGFARGTKVKKAKRLVTIAAYGVRGMRVDAFRQLIEGYLAADGARRALAQK